MTVLPKEKSPTFRGGIERKYTENNKRASDSLVYPQPRQARHATFFPERFYLERFLFCLVFFFFYGGGGGISLPHPTSNSPPLITILLVFILL